MFRFLSSLYEVDVFNSFIGFIQKKDLQGLIKFHNNNKDKIQEFILKDPQDEAKNMTHIISNSLIHYFSKLEKVIKAGTSSAQKTMDNLKTYKTMLCYFMKEQGDCPINQRHLASAPFVIK
jgi:hypothetical protein